MASNTTAPSTTFERLTLLQAAAYTEWYDAIAPSLIRWLESHGPATAAIAEDISQETWIKVFAHAAQLAEYDPDRRRKYVYSIAARINHDRMRDHVRHDRMSGGAASAIPLGAFDAPDALPDVQAVTASHDWIANATEMEQTTAARMSLAAVWEWVPVEQRELLLMVVYGYGRGEMAAHFGISVGAVNMRLFYLRKTLRAVREKIV